MALWQRQTPPPPPPGTPPPPPPGPTPPPPPSPASGAPGYEPTHDQLMEILRRIEEKLDRIEESLRK